MRKKLQHTAMCAAPQKAIFHFAFHPKNRHSEIKKFEISNAVGGVCLCGINAFVLKNATSECDNEKFFNPNHFV
jgi:hypothetical protein